MKSYYNPVASTLDLVNREGWRDWGCSFEEELRMEMRVREEKNPSILERLTAFVHQLIP